jgi:hypothetical protein
LFFSLVRNQIVCIDDIERRGASLPVGEVLGLVSFLREQRKCKVALLLNDRALGTNGETEFAGYLEKVVDVFIRFSPQPEDSIRIALPGADPGSVMIGENCRTLGISNIRVIKKIERAVRTVEQLVVEFHEQVFYQAAHSLTLLTWSKYQPETAPALVFLKTRKGMDYFGTKDDKNVPAEESAWNALLDTYQFSLMDEFDLTLLKGVENGYFDPEEIKKYAAELDRTIKANQQGGSFEESWRAYHDSFTNNQEEVLDGIYDSFKRNVQSITPLNVNGTVLLFKELGRDNQAKELIQYYVNQRKDGRNLWDLARIMQRI